jgi:hypothetical protein
MLNQTTHRADMRVVSRTSRTDSRPSAGTAVTWARITAELPLAGAVAASARRETLSSRARVAA